MIDLWLSLCPGVGFSATVLGSEHKTMIAKGSLMISLEESGVRFMADNRLSAIFMVN